MNRNPNTREKRLLVVLVCCMVVALIGMIVILCNPRQEPAPFTPPPFDPAAVQGTPEVPEELGYHAPYQEGMGYRFSVCGNVRMHGAQATVYLTNPKENNVWIKLRIMDANGNLLGETGLIKPGEYVKTVTVTQSLAVGTPIKLKIMGYEPDTYYSAGGVTLNTTVRYTD